LWYKALYSKNIPSDYFTWANEQPLLVSDELLPDLQKALQNISDPKILAQLVELLRGRIDDVSVTLLLKFLDHPDVNVRYFSAQAAKDNKSLRLLAPEVQNRIREILRKG
jgi:hypothetical protein